MYPKVITVCQRKGGSAKTTTARYVAEYLARFKKLRVLSMDLDNQANLSMLLLNMEGNGDRIMPPLFPGYDPQNNPEDREWGGRASTADLIETGFFAAYDVTTPTPIPGWEICPADSVALYKLAQHDDPVVRNGVVENLRFNIEACCQDYDVIVIDTGPTTNSLLLAAIKAATHVLIPFVPEPQSSKGLGEMLALVRRENESRPASMPEVQMLGILPSKVDKRLSIHAGILESMARSPIYSKFMIPFWVPDRAIFKELDSEQPSPSSIFEVPKRKDSDLREYMISACEHIYQKIWGTN